MTCSYSIRKKLVNVKKKGLFCNYKTVLDVFVDYLLLIYLVNSTGSTIFPSL